MLNTREAARFLRVSQATVRRWFDAGLLPGYRVGRRKERRFYESDLLAFMERSIPAAAGVRGLHVGGIEVRPPAHFAAFSSSDAGAVRVTAPFLADGVRLRQPTFLVASGAMLDAYAKVVDLDGVHVVSFEGGAAADAISQWENSFTLALAGGPTVIRVVGEMAEERPMFSSEDEMLHYEEAFEAMSRRYPAVTICQYDVRHFEGLTVLRALKAHPDLFQYPTGAFFN